MHLQENTLFDLELWVKVTKKMVPSVLYFMGFMHLHRLKLLCQKVEVEIHLQENSIFDLDLGVKYCI